MMMFDATFRLTEQQFTALQMLLPGTLISAGRAAISTSNGHAPIAKASNGQPRAMVAVMAAFHENNGLIANYKVLMSHFEKVGLKATGAGTYLCRLTKTGFLSRTTEGWRLAKNG